MLSQAGVAFTEREIFQRPLSREELRALLGPRPAVELFSARSPRVKGLGLQGQALSEGEMLALMGREPTLIRRPLLTVDGQLLIQPSPQTLAELLAEISRGEAKG